MQKGSREIRINLAFGKGEYNTWGIFCFSFVLLDAVAVNSLSDPLGKKRDDCQKPF